MGKPKPDLQFMAKVEEALQASAWFKGNVLERFPSDATGQVVDRLAQQLESLRIQVARLGGEITDTCTCCRTKDTIVHPMRVFRQAGGQQYPGYIWICGSCLSDATSVAAHLKRLQTEREAVHYVVSQSEKATINNQRATMGLGPLDDAEWDPEDFSDLDQEPDTIDTAEEIKTLRQDLGRAMRRYKDLEMRTEELAKQNQAAACALEAALKAKAAAIVDAKEAIALFFGDKQVMGAFDISECVARDLANTLFERLQSQKGETEGTG